MIEFALQLDELPGWADLTVAADGRILKTECSYVVDTPGDVARSLLDLSRGGPKCDVTADAENGEVCLTLRRVRDELHVSARRYQWFGDTAPPHLVDRAMRTHRRSDWRKMGQSRHRAAILRRSGPIIAAVRSYWHALHSVEVAIGAREYRKRWGHPYPGEAMEALRSLF